MFVDTTRVAVTEGENTIYIKPKMDYGTRNAILGAAADARLDAKGNVSAPKIEVGRYQNALLVHNIVAWEGPAFATVVCTPANILRLDPDEPLVVKVLEEIARRNPQKQSPVPNSRTASGSSTTGGSDSIPSGSASQLIAASQPS